MPALALALVVAATLHVLPDPAEAEPGRDDPDALLEAVLRAGVRPRAAPAPCDERFGWLGDDDARAPAPCDDDEDAAWLVAPAPAPGAPEGD